MSDQCGNRCRYATCLHCNGNLRALFSDISSAGLHASIGPTEGTNRLCPHCGMAMRIDFNQSRNSELWVVSARTARTTWTPPAPKTSVHELERLLSEARAAEELRQMGQGEAALEVGQPPPTPPSPPTFTLQEALNLALILAPFIFWIFMAYR